MTMIMTMYMTITMTMTMPKIKTKIMTLTLTLTMAFLFWLKGRQPTGQGPAVYRKVVSCTSGALVRQPWMHMQFRIPPPGGRPVQMRLPHIFRYPLYLRFLHLTGTALARHSGVSLLFRAFALHSGAHLHLTLR